MAGRPDTLPAQTEPPGSEPTGHLATVEVIEQAALEAFYRTGYHGASIREIAKRANVGIATLFHHFPSKHAILERILHRAIDELEADLRGQLAEVRDPVERLMAAVRVLVVMHCEKQMPSFVARSELRSLEPRASEEVRKKRVRVQDAFEEIVRDGIASGDFDCDQPMHVALAIVSAGTMVATWYRSDGSQTPQEIADMYVSFAMRLVGAVVPEGAVTVRTM